LKHSADEEFLGFFAGITVSLILFCRKTELHVYIRIAEALETLDGDGDCMGCKTVTGISVVNARITSLRDPLSADEVTVTTQLEREHMTVEVPGRHTAEMMDGAPEAIIIPDPRLLVDYMTAPCNHGCKVITLRRHVRQASKAMSSLNSVKKSLMRATTGQCSTDSSACHSDTVKEVAKLDRPGFRNDENFSEATLFCAATLHRFGLPYGYAKLSSETLPEMCSCCKAPLWDPAVRGSRMEKIFALSMSFGEIRRRWKETPSLRGGKAGFKRPYTDQPQPMW